jgi:hypothetical protein
MGLLQVVMTMCEINSICVEKSRLGNIKIARLGGILVFKNLNIRGGDDNAILLNLLKEVIPF